MTKEEFTKTLKDYSILMLTSFEYEKHTKEDLISLIKEMKKCTEAS